MKDKIIKPFTKWLRFLIWLFPRQYDPWWMAEYCERKNNES